MHNLEPTPCRFNTNKQKLSLSKFKISLSLTVSRPPHLNYVLDKSVQRAVLRKLRFRKNLFLENWHEVPTELLVLALAESYYTTWHFNSIVLEQRNSSLNTPLPPPLPLSRGHFCLSG